MYPSDTPGPEPLLPAGGVSTFLAIEAAGSISAAADHLFLSQPAVSRRLQALERQLGAALFDRTPSGLRLTDAGRAFRPHAERALAAETDAWRAVVGRRDGEHGTVALGVVGSLVEPYLTAVLRLALQRHPDIEIEVTTATTARICDLVRRGVLEVGVSYATPDDPDLDCRLLTRERQVTVCGPDHPSAGGRLAASQLADHRWLVFPEHPGHPESSGTVARRVLQQHQVPASKLREIDSLSAQRSLVMAGYGLALLPEGMIAADVAAGRLAIVDSRPLAIDAAITVATRRKAHLAPATETVLDLLLPQDEPG